MNLTPDQWRSTLGFVPTKEARSAATRRKIDFLTNVRKGNPLVTFPALQKALLGKPNDVVYQLDPSYVQWLARELGDQLLTLCLKESRQSVTTFVIYSLHTIDINVLFSISIKGKKARFRDWRDVLFTTVKELPVVNYKNKLQFPLPEGYQLVSTNHEMLMAAEQFNNCSFNLSNKYEIIEGDEFVLIIPSRNGVEPIMFHGIFSNDYFISLVEAKHPNNLEVSSECLEEVVNLLNTLCLQAAPEGYELPVHIPYYDDGLWVDNVFDDED